MLRLLVALAVATAPVPPAPGGAGAVSPPLPPKPPPPGLARREAARQVHYRFKHHHECQTLRCARHADHLWWELHRPRAKR
jgi:hypothetical protein